MHVFGLSGALAERSEKSNNTVDLLKVPGSDKSIINHASSAKAVGRSGLKVSKMSDKGC